MCTLGQNLGAVLFNNGHRVRHSESWTNSVTYCRVCHSLQVPLIRLTKAPPRYYIPGSVTQAGIDPSRPSDLQSLKFPRPPGKPFGSLSGLGALRRPFLESLPCIVRISEMHTQGHSESCIQVLFELSLAWGLPWHT